MKLTMIALLLIVANAQSAFAANCSGRIYQYNKVNQDRYVLNSMESAFFNDGAECVSNIETQTTNCIELSVKDNVVHAVINKTQTVALVGATTALQNLPREDRRSQLGQFFGNDLQQGNFSLAALVEMKNKKDVLGISVNCK